MAAARTPESDASECGARRSTPSSSGDAGDTLAANVERKFPSKNVSAALNDTKIGWSNTAASGFTRARACDASNVTGPGATALSWQPASIAAPKASNIALLNMEISDSGSPLERKAAPDQAMSLIAAAANEREILPACVERY